MLPCTKLPEVFRCLWCNICKELHLYPPGRLSSDSNTCADGQRLLPGVEELAWQRCDPGETVTPHQKTQWGCSPHALLDATEWWRPCALMTTQQTPPRCKFLGSLSKRRRQTARQARLWESMGASSATGLCCQTIVSEGFLLGKAVRDWLSGRVTGGPSKSRLADGKFENSFAPSV